MSTNGKFKLSLAVAVLLPLFFVTSQAIGQQEAPKTSPWIVFVATVESANAVNLASLKPSPNTSVVVVEKVLGKPDAVTLAKGDSVTVLIEGTTGLKTGVRGLFFTEGWVFGENLAVRVRSWEPMAAGPELLSAADSKATAWMQAAADKDIQASIASAEINIVGRVQKIQAPSVPLLASSAMQRVSEHNPDWQEAIIEVQETLKGSPDLKQVVVRFPSSVDVMWVDYPKFKAGQEGTFLLRQDRLSGATKATLEGKAVTAYTSVSQKDSLSKADSETIKRVLKTNP